MKKRFLSLILSAAMVVSLSNSLVAQADELGSEQTTVAEQSVEEVTNVVSEDSTEGETSDQQSTEQQEEGSEQQNDAGQEQGEATEQNGAEQENEATQEGDNNPEDEGTQENESAPVDEGTSDNTDNEEIDQQGQGSEETNEEETHEHSFGDWTVKTPATCTEEGEETRSCTVEGCTETESQTIPATNHHMDEQTGTHCTNDGCDYTEEATVMIGQTGYKTLELAVKDAAADATIVLTSDITANVTIDKNLTIDLNGHTITADGTAITTTSGASVTLISNGESKGTIKGATTGAIKANGALTLKNLVFTNNAENTAREDGGAVDIQGGLLTVSDCDFTSNTAADGGGAISVHHGAGIKIIDSTLKANSANEGGAIYIWDSCGENLSIKDCTFEENTVKSTGGAIYAGAGQLVARTVNVTGSTFTSNKAVQGGAICNYGITNFITDSCTFTKNSAPNGGAVYNISGYSDNGSTFEENTATGNWGGAIYSQPYIYVGQVEGTEKATKLTNSKFVKNTSGYGAGAVFTYMSQDSFEGVSFSENVAKYYGGAYYSYFSNATVTNAIFDGNTAEFCGGAVYTNLSRQDTYELKVSGSSFENNSVKWYGGAIYVNKNNTLSMDGNCTVINNSADIYAGGIVNVGTVSLASGAQLYNNTAKTAGDDIYGNGKLNLPATSTDWKLTDGTVIDGWYKDMETGDEESYRWSLKDAIDLADVESYKAVVSEDGSVSMEAGAVYGIKAARGTYYTVSYDVTGDAPEGQTTPDSVTLKKGSSFTVADAFAPVKVVNGNTTRTYTFSGWTVDGKAVSGQQTVSKDMKITGSWSYTEETVEPTPEPTPAPSPAPSNGGSSDGGSSSSTSYVTITNTTVPLAGPEETDTTTIADEETPLAGPKTADSNTIFVFIGLLAAGLAAAGRGLVESKKKED